MVFIVSQLSRFPQKRAVVYLISRTGDCLIVAKKKRQHFALQVRHYCRLRIVFVSEINRYNEEQNIDKRNWGEKDTRSSEPLNIKGLPS